MKCHYYSFALLILFLFNFLRFAKLICFLIFILFLILFFIKSLFFQNSPLILRLVKSLFFLNPSIRAFIQRFYKSLFFLNSSLILRLWNKIKYYNLNLKNNLGGSLQNSYAATKSRERKHSSRLITKETAQFEGENNEERGRRESEWPRSWNDSDDTMK